MTTIDQLTPVAQDYLKIMWSGTEWGAPPITNKALATRLGTTPANVTETLKRLATQGLVHSQPYRPARLTDEGARLAVAMVRRHRLIEAFLVNALGYTWDEVHQEAETLEHGASDLFIHRIDALLGHPTTDPHGDPIPAADGTVHRPLAIPLSQTTGGHRVVRVSDADPEVLSRCSALGIVPNASVDAASTPADLADAIWVDPTPAGGGPAPQPRPGPQGVTGLTCLPPATLT